MAGTFRDQILRVGKASASFADLDTDGLPDTSGVTFYGLAAIFDAGKISGLTRNFNDADHVRQGLGASLTSPEGFLTATGGAAFGSANGTFIGEEFGDLAVTHRLRNVGTGGSFASTAFDALMTSTWEKLTPSAVSTAVSAAGANAGVFDVGTGDGSEFTEGAVIACVINNRIEYAVVTDVSTDTIKVNPYFSRALDSGDTVIHCVNYYPKLGAPTARDVFVTFDAGGPSTAANIRRIAAGCRLAGNSLTFDGETAIMGHTIRPAVVLPDDTNASVAQASEFGGAACQFVGSYTVVGGDHSGTSAPVTTARTALSMYGWSAEMAFGVQPSAPSQSVLTRTTDLEITNATCRVTLTGTYASTLRNLLRLEEQRTIVLGMGPAAAGQGAALVLTSASAADGATQVRGGDGDRVEMEMIVEATDWNGVSNTTALASAPFILAFPMPAS